MATKRAAAASTGDVGRNLAIGADAGVAVGILANFARKAIVQAPTIAAG